MKIESIVFYIVIPVIILVVLILKSGGKGKRRLLMEQVLWPGISASACWEASLFFRESLFWRTCFLRKSFQAEGEFRNRILEDFRKGWVGRWLEEMDKLEFQICLAAGKPFLHRFRR